MTYNSQPHANSKENERSGIILFFAIEGADGARKMTLVNNLSEKLHEEGVFVTTLSFQRFYFRTYITVHRRRYNIRPKNINDVVHVGTFQKKSISDTNWEAGVTFITDRYLHNRVVYE